MKRTMRLSLPPIFRKFVRRLISKISPFIPVIIKKPLKRIIPKRAWTAFRHIYPIEIPPICFLPDRDFILLNLPKTSIPNPPNGLGYVHNILKSTGICFQTIDLNVIFYHHYHSRRILDKPGKDVSLDGSAIKGDPWDVVNTEEEWNKPEILECFRPEINEIIDGLVKARPKIIGISVCGTNRTITREVVKGVRALYPEVIILVGGYDCVYHYVGPYLFKEYDYMVIGEAELTLGPLVKALVAGNKPKDIPGVISKYDSPDRTWIKGPLLEDLDSIDFPKYDWINLNLYRTYEGAHTVSIIASRGCRWSKCRFCAECFTWRKRSPQKVVDEIEWFTKQGLNMFWFNESDINGDPDATIEICNEIIRRGLKISFSGQLRVHKRGTLEFFKCLHAAGCLELTFGVDGWTDHLMQLQRKGVTMNIVEKNLCNCHETGIRVNANMVIGIPGETEEDVEEGVNNIIKCKRHIDSMQNINILILAAGSEYYLHPEHYNIRFREEKLKLYKKFPYFIPPDLWYSVNPYIDKKVRIDHFKKIYSALDTAGVKIGNRPRWQVKSYT